MSPDLIFVIVLTILFIRAIPPRKDQSFGGELIGSFIATLLIYSIVKIPFHCGMGGWTFPVNPDPKLHWISGSISFVIVAALWLLAGHCRKNNTNVWALIRVRK